MNTSRKQVDCTLMFSHVIQVFYKHLCSCLSLGFYIIVTSRDEAPHSTQQTAYGLSDRTHVVPLISVQ